eukprot:2526888-Ditylum_brightwellii.AAC.1
MDTMHERRNNHWYECSSVLRQTGRSTYCKFSLTQQESQPPDDSIPAVCIKSGLIIQSTGWTAFSHHQPQHEPQTFIEAMTSGSSSTTWATHEAESTDNGKYIAEAIRSGTALAVSDGSFKYGRGSAVCIMEGKVPGLHQITAMAT